MATFSVIFAYNSTTSIPAAGAQRQTFSISYARATSQLEGVRHELVDDSRKRDVTAKTLILEFHLGREILKVATNRSFFRSFFEAKHRWAVYGDFKDTANSANDNLCKCDPPEDAVEVNSERDREGYILESEKVFSV